jgi:hypothetical protein
MLSNHEINGIKRLARGFPQTGRPAPGYAGKRVLTAGELLALDINSAYQVWILREVSTDLITFWARIPTGRGGGFTRFFCSMEREREAERTLERYWRML